MPRHHAHHDHARAREAVALFSDMTALQEAVGDLEARTFPRDSISVMGSPREVEMAFGESAVQPDRAENNPDTPRGVLLRREERAIGAGILIGGGIYAGATLALLAAARNPGVPAALPVAVGGIIGGALGLLGAWLLGRYLDRQVEAQLRKGGLLLWVRTPDRRRERLALSILKSRGARYVHIHRTPY
jgi:hypothetical protein